MERSRAARNRNKRCSNYNNISESEYDVVDDQEEVLNVRILPARPLNDDREYADRDPPRSASSPSLSSFLAGNSNVSPREMPISPAPAINRDLKPNRKRIRLDRPHRRAPPAPPGDQHTPSSCPSPTLFALELANHLAGLSLREPVRRDGQRTTKNVEPSQNTKGRQSAESVSTAHNNIQRHSLDLETHDLEKRSHQNLERVPSRRHHHEWPQTKEDIDQNDFIPMEKPQQTYEEEEDWYVGACNRADAEHALHLVNKDGAFLVRDCSISSSSEPFVLAVYHEKKVYNVKIRFIDSMSKYVLGTGQRSNDMFDSVADIIKFHSIFPIILISGRNMPGNRYPENCVLTCPVTKRDVEQLLG